MFFMNCEKQESEKKNVCKPKSFIFSFDTILLSAG